MRRPLSADVVSPHGRNFKEVFVIMDNRRKKIRERIGLKIFAVIIAVILFGVCFLSGVLTMLCLQNDVYIDGGENLFYDAVYLAANLNLNGFINRLSSMVPLRFENGRPDRSEIDERMTGLLQDECNYIIVMKNADGVQLYSTGQSASAHVYGYQRIVWDAPNVFQAVDINVAEKCEIAFEDIYLADEEMLRLVRESGFTGKLYAVLGYRTQYGAEVYDYVVISETDENGDVTYSDDFAYYAEIYKKVNEAIASSSLFYTIIPQADSFDPSKVVDGFEIVDPEDGKTYMLYVDSNGYWQYRGEEVEPQYIVNFLNELLISSDRSRLYKYLNLQSTGMTFSLVGEFYPTQLDEYYIDVYVDKTPEHLDSVYFSVKAVGYITELSGLFPIALLVTGVLLLIFLIFIICAAGHRYGVDGIVPIWFDKIPFELFVGLNIVAAVLFVEDYQVLVYNDVFTGFYSYRLLELSVIFAFPFAVGLLMILTVMTLATRLKAQCFWKYTAIGMVVSLVIKVFRFIGLIFKNIRLTWKVILLCAAMVFVDFFAFIVFNTNYPFFGVFIWFVSHVLLTILLLMWAIGFTRIRDYSKKVAQGELGSRIDRDYLFGDLKRTADDLEGVGEGVRRAVDERMRSERLKTELITNVSHDLKTPLTSIVNYVDILSKDDIQDESAKEHINVLKRQAARMKKLIEDLVEVSKASSGNVSVNLERTDVNLLLTQTVTEYSQKFEDGKLVSVVKIPEQKMIANLDGRLMWRVLDNLCNNICKYALAGTRVYITAEDRGDAISVSFKNISRFPLDISGEDLMERFVRGDSSRNTEGSGLGLSIAKSLCDLQSVGFNLAIDGDLFKAELTITKANDDELLNDEPIVYSEPLEMREHRVAPDYEEPSVETAVIAPQTPPAETVTENETAPEAEPVQENETFDNTETQETE